MMTPLKIGFFGFGKTGQEVIKEFFKEDLFEVSWVVRKSDQSRNKFASRLLGLEFDAGRIFSLGDINLKFYSQNPVDMIVDFSSSEGMEYYVDGARQGIKIISAISNYHHEQLDVLEKIKDTTAILYSPNITLGINFLLVASQLLSKIAPHADVEIIEEHFRDKKDVSGTALKIADVLGLDKRKHVNSIRVGGIVGRHEIVFGLPNQTIRLVHDSISRKAFGQGAIFAAKWLHTQPNGLYSMENIVTEMMRENLPVY
jgi:4-hydroxy-tetrahydrodipicolinate reductase